MQKFIAYKRVSTLRQERSGLGLEGQDELISRYVSSVGGIVVDQYKETESGKLVDRPELRKALAACRKHKAVLLVGKIDRLARNVAFVSALLEQPGIELRAADMPQADRSMLQVYSVFAEMERKAISDRTKAALAARRARGLPLGTLANLLRGNSIAPAKNKAKAIAAAERLRPIVDSIRRDGHTTHSGIAAELNRRGYSTEGGGSFHATTISRVLDRLNPVQAMSPARCGQLPCPTTP